MLIVRDDLILNNKPGKVTRPSHQNTTSVINLKFTTQEIGTLDSWIIDRELSTPSDHEVIRCDLANQYETVRGMETSQKVIGCRVKVILDGTRKEACKDLHQAVAERLRREKGA